MKKYVYINIYFARLKNIHMEILEQKKKQKALNQFSEINGTWSTSGLLNSCNRTLVNTKDTHVTSSSHMYVCVLTNRERTERLFRSRAVTIARQGRRNQTEANQTSTRRDLTRLSLSSVIARFVISEVVREIRFSCDR